MPRTRSLAWAELKFGLIAVFALVMAGLLIFAVGGGGGFFWQNYPLKVQFPNVAGLMSGSPVRVAGVEVGAVTDVDARAQRRRSVVQRHGRHAAAHHRSLDGEDRIDLAAGGGGGGYRGRAGWHAASGLGLCGHRQAGADHRGADRASRHGDRRRHRVDRRLTRRQGHDRQVVDR